jgi:DNA repair exonuclease SbcCD ATPase subunit
VLKDYPKISANFLLPPASPAPEIDLETDQFSLIISDQMNISDLVRDNAVLAEELRSTKHEREEALRRLDAAEGRAGVGAGDLARKVALYERMAKIKSDYEYVWSFIILCSSPFPSCHHICCPYLYRSNRNHKTQEKRLLAEQVRTTEEKLERERHLWEEEKKKLEEGKTEKEAFLEAMKHNFDVEAREQRQEMEKLRAQVSFYRTQEREMESLRAKEREKNLELERLREQLQNLDAHAQNVEAQRQELERLRAQLAEESAARQSAEEVADALTTQVALLRDTVMAYEVSYGLDMQPAPQT